MGSLAQTVIIQMMTDDERERLRQVEVSVADIRVKQQALEGLLQENIRATSDVKRDTAEIVSLMKGASVIGRLARWVTFVIGGYLAGKGLKWW